jgi:hypothetical protein
MQGTLASRMDKLAGRLLAAAERAATVDDKVALFGAVGGWLSIKHQIGARRQVRDAGQPPKRRGFEHDSPERQRQRALRRWGRSDDSEPGDGSGLPALRAMLAQSGGEISR